MFSPKFSKPALLVIPAAMALALAGCHDNDRNTSRDDRNSSTAYGQGGRNEAVGADAKMFETDADRKILSIVHAINQKEIAAGSLAMQRGNSSKVRSYGDMLVRHHSENDSELLALANRKGIQLMSADEVKDMKTRSMDASDRTRNDMNKMDPMAKLSGYTGEAFDREFANDMSVGHKKAIATVTEARTRVQDTEIKAFLDRTLPTLREHEREATEMAMKR